MAQPESRARPDVAIGLARAPGSRTTWKDVLLGRPKRTADLAHERLGKPTALAVFASDNLSSSAYATEEILRVLIPVIGIAAFALVVPVTLAMIVVLGFLILSYRQTIKAYPSSGGAYVVTKDNFGDGVATVAGGALLTDYVLTVAVSVAAGTAAVTSPLPSLRPYSVPIAIGFIVLIAFGNLRGVRESGFFFAIPTYFFMVNMAVLLGTGLWREFFGALPVDPGGHEGVLHFGSPGDGLFMGAALFVVLHAFASGGAAVTGVEAISNGVGAFRVPEWRNARTTLVIMGTALGAMFIGLSFLASRVHPTPFEEGTPTVISQIGRLVYGPAAIGDGLYVSLQVGTALILVLAANTAFADFPRLASTAAADSFLPHWLTKRGHRLVFSNGVFLLAAGATVLVIATRAKVERLIPLYAIGVFTSFTLSQAGMTKHHVRLREPGWKRGIAINGLGAVISGLVAIIVAVTKFADGAWLILLAIPLIVYALMRTNHAYTRERSHLDLDIKDTFRPPLPRHRVVVLISKLDRSSLKALQYARQLRPLSMVAVHVAVDPDRARQLQQDWTEVGVPITLEVLDCPHRDLVETVTSYVAELVESPGTQVTVLLPIRRYQKPWHRFLHDADAKRLGREVGKLANVNLTVVPFALAAVSQRRLSAVD